MKYIVTGATGMIGRALLKKITDNGDEAIALINPLSSRASFLPDDVKVEYCSLDDYKNYELNFSADIFIHLAWKKTDAESRDDEDAQSANISYTLSAIDIARKAGCKKFVGAGSQAEFGIKSEPLGCDTEAEPQSEYGKAKLAACLAAKEKCERYGLNFNWCRILSVYGESDSPNTLVSYIISCFKKGENPVLTKCEQTWDYIYCDDCANAIYLIAKNGVNGKAYPIGSGRARMLKDYVLDIAEEIGYNNEVVFGQREYYPHQPMYLCADISELSRDTGFVPKYSFKEGIKKLLKMQDCGN